MREDSYSSLLNQLTVRFVLNPILCLNYQEIPHFHFASGMYVI